MCGITGFVDFSGGLHEDVLRRMTATLRHRGPDDEGHSVIVGGSARVGLGHTRLSILDLSSAGHQPLQRGPYSIVYNGEIYNFRQIRSELEERGHGFASDCDTEVVLHAFAEWGIDSLHRFIGMFAFVLHDAAEQQVYFVRDRVGVKPLYVYCGPHFWLFGSELKALRACPPFPARLSLPDLYGFFRHGHVPDDGCIFEDCHKVDGGTYWRLDLTTGAHDRVRWWDQTHLYEQPRSPMGFEDAADELEALLHSACEYRMVADVPVGVFLSGGYDSTAVTAILQSRSDRPIKTFTIGFTEGNDEAPFARATAARLGTEHHELYCSPHEAMEVIPDLPEIFDEPFADSSGIPTLLVSRLARSSVKVALSADGGDELFGGYPSYAATAGRVDRLRRIPATARPWAGALFQRSARLLPQSAHSFRHRVDGLGRSMRAEPALMGQRLHGHARLMPRSLVDQLLPEAAGCGADFGDREWPDRTEAVEAAMGLDYQTYLKDDIMTKVDRATMSVGLEGREPLLDHRLAEFAATLPVDYKFDGAITKRILRGIVHRHVPEEMMARPKAGFSLPIMSWLRNDLRDFFEAYCSRAALDASGPLHSSVAANWISDFHRSRFHYSPLIWRLVTFQAWFQRWG